MTRKNLVLKNIGAEIDAAAVQQYPGVAEVRTNIVLVDRLLLALLRTEFEKFRDEDRTRAYLTHFIDPIAGEDLREKLVSYFKRQPPVAVLGYPRTGAEFPCVAITLREEQENEAFLADFVGETTEEEDTSDAAEYLGKMFDCTYTIWIFAENPDITSALYQIVKMLLVGANRVLVSSGFLDVRVSGTELVPEAEFIPENMFVRTINISGKTNVTVPQYSEDPANFRVAVYRNDVVVEGLRGGVTSYDPDEG